MGEITLVDRASQITVAYNLQYKPTLHRYGEIPLTTNLSTQTRKQYHFYSKTVSPTILMEN